MDYIVHKAVELDALSKKAKAELAKNTDWIISPKYDGCHAIFAFDDGKFIGAYSRSGELVRSMDHVADELLRMYQPTGRTAICGEAWVFGKEFNEISGMFRRHSPQPELGFVPFDIVPFDYNDQGFGGAPLLLNPRCYTICTRPYSRRIRMLINDRKEGWSKHCFLPVAVTLNCSLDDALEKADALAKDYKKRTDSFYDGVVLANANGKYIVGAGKGGEFIKVKSLISFTVTVTGAEIAKGEKTGKNTAALKFMLDGHEQKVSTGLTQAQVDEITKEFITRPYCGTGPWLGCRIEVEAMGFTVNGLLREPRFKGLRHDA